METSAETVDGPGATPEEVQHAFALLERDGLIPVADPAGHRGALQLWRQHCQETHLFKAMLAAAQQVLNQARPALQGAFDGQTQTEQLASVQPADNPITTHPSSPTTTASRDWLSWR